MEKLKTIATRKYYLLSCHRFIFIKGSKKFDESIILRVTNDGGSICFSFTDTSTKEEIRFDNPKSDEYIVPIIKGNEIKISIVASKAIGAYKIVRKITKE